MTIDPASAGSPQEIYKLLIGAIVPRPIAFVSTIDPEGRRNLAPFSFFTVISANPPVVCFSTMVRPTGHKDTLRNIDSTGEFVVNIVSEDFGPQMNLCSGDYPHGTDEFEISGLTPVASDLVKPARVGESRFQMECRLLQVVRISEQTMGGSLIIGEVVRFHAADELFDSHRRIDPAKLNAIGRMGGTTYTRTADLFDIPRPQLG